jgi:hypothetical protein
MQVPFLFLALIVWIFILKSTISGITAIVAYALGFDATFITLTALSAIELVLET